MRFPLIDRYMGLRMDVELETLRPGELVVVESRRRLRKELSYGFIHAAWCLWLTDGRFAAIAHCQGVIGLSQGKLVESGVLLMICSNNLILSVDKVYVQLCLDL